MLRRVLFVSTLMLASTIGFAGSAKAEPVSNEAIFNGTVAASCSIEATEEGILVSPNGLSLTSEADEGSPATVVINCPGGEVSVAAPVANAALLDNKAEGLTSATSEATVALRDIDGEADSSGTTLEIPDDTTTAVTGTVNMTVTNGTPLPAGEYSYAVTVTVTPEVAPL